jgi:predicted regulator of Ras-like GTPase activity (Roadblock/LC7/MglB family)
MQSLVSMQSILSELNSTSNHIEASAIISKRGLVVASSMSENISEVSLGGITAAMLSVCTKYSQEFFGNLDQVMVTSTQGYVLMTQAGEDAYLTVITDIHDEFESIFTLLKTAATKVASSELAA